MKILTTSFLLYFYIFAFAQTPKLFPTIPKANDFSFIYNNLNVDIQPIIQAQYNRVTQWYETYQKSETDESGLVWSVPVLSYQACVLQINQMGLENITYYDAENNRLRRLDFYYIDGLVSAVDEFKFDKEQKEQLLFTDAYFYEANGKPAQKTRKFNREPNLREMVTYRFNEENQLNYQKTEYVGKATRAQTISLIETGKQLLNWEYGNTTRRTIYQNHSELIELYEYQIEANLIKIVKCYGYNHQLISINECFYKSDKLQHISSKLSQAATISKDNLTQAANIETYFFYDEDGFLQRIMVEQGDFQEVFNYSYSKN
jgi:hypothetical protein